MTEEAGLIGLLHRADWTRLSLSAQVSDGSTVVIAPGKRYRYETAGYVTGCDGGRPWELSDEGDDSDEDDDPDEDDDSDEDDDDDDGEVHWISGPEPPVRRLLCPAWLLEGSRLEVRGRVRVCGRAALDVVATALPGPRGSTSGLRRGAAEAAVDAELGILLRVAGLGSGGEPDVLELVTADSSERAGAVRLTSMLRIAGPNRYQIDCCYGPKSGPLRLACDGEHLWRVYADKVTKAPAEPPPSDVRELADPSWLLRCWLAGGTSVLVGDRPAYRIDVVRRHDYPSIFMTAPAAVAVVDAELGVIVRLTSYLGGKPVWRYELQDLAAAPDDFRADVPADLPVTEAGRFDDFRAGPPVTLGRLLARQAATEATKAARTIVNRLGNIGRR